MSWSGGQVQGEPTKLDRPTEVGNTGHSVSITNTEILKTELDRKPGIDAKSRRTFTCPNDARLWTWTKATSYYPSTARSFHRCLSLSSPEHQYVIKACRSKSKRHTIYYYVKGSLVICSTCHVFNQFYSRINPSKQWCDELSFHVHVSMSFPLILRWKSAFRISILMEIHGW